MLIMFIFLFNYELQNDSLHCCIQINQNYKFVTYQWNWLHTVLSCNARAGRATPLSPTSAGTGYSSQPTPPRSMPERSFRGRLTAIIRRHFFNAPTLNLIFLSIFLNSCKMSAAYKIVMIRHGESEWNQENRFCGWFDANLSEKGLEEAKNGGQALKADDYKFDVAHTSLLTRAQVTLNSVLEIIEQTDIPIHKTWRLNERHYGGKFHL